MITREDIKRAVDGIASRDPETGRALDEMLSSGAIDVLPDDEEDDVWGFLFLARRVAVRRFLFFHHGPVAIGERLLFEYGKLVKRQTVLRPGRPADWREASLDIEDAGRSFLVEHVLHHAVRSRPPGAERDRLVRCLESSRDLVLPTSEEDPAVLFEGVVDIDTPAYVARFSFGREPLMQVAGLNLEFFAIEMLVEILRRGHESDILAAVVRGRIAGLMFLDRTDGRSRAALEVKYIATRPARPGRPGVARGIGALLIAGAWMLWRQHEPALAGIVLDSEIEARSFYLGLGFRRRRPHEYDLGNPRGYLLRNIVAMANHVATLAPRVRDEIVRAVRREAKRLLRTPLEARDDASRLRTALFFEECLRSRRHPCFARAAVEELVAHGQGRPLGERLLASAAEYGLVRRPGESDPDRSPVLVVVDDRFAGHLSGVLHIESRKRTQAAHEMLRDPTLAGRTRRVAPRQATVEELRLVHTPEHIRRIAETSRRRLTALDPETLASSESWDVARLAVGGLFNLLDEITSGAGNRGFAFLRPPGHHAETDRALGYCLFNNIALGARYLLRRKGLGRVMIVDIDAHHGNGTQRIFYATEEVLYVSLHGHRGIPDLGDASEVGVGEGEGYTVNVPLLRRGRDRAVIDIVNTLVRDLARQYAPDMILVSCGFDLYLHDPIADMRVTPLGYALVTELLIEFAEEACGGRLAFIMEGGYSIRGIRECGLRVMQTLCGRAPGNRRELERMAPATRVDEASIVDVARTQRRYWNLT